LADISARFAPSYRFSPIRCCSPNCSYSYMYFYASRTLKIVFCDERYNPSYVEWILIDCIILSVEQFHYIRWNALLHFWDSFWSFSTFFLRFKEIQVVCECLENGPLKAMTCMVGQVSKPNWKCQSWERRPHSLDIFYTQIVSIHKVMSSYVLMQVFTYFPHFLLVRNPHWPLHSLWWTVGNLCVFYDVILIFFTYIIKESTTYAVSKN
jgi:hypothetical protein